MKSSVTVLLKATPYSYGSLGSKVPAEKSHVLVNLVGIGLEVSVPVPTRILHPLMLRIEQGSTLSVVGPSGAGKTTLASIIGMLQPASEGEYFFQGQLVSDMNARQRADFRRDHIGYVFQTVGNIKISS